MLTASNFFENVHFILLYYVCFKPAVSTKELTALPWRRMTVLRYN